MRCRRGRRPRGACRRGRPEIPAVSILDLGMVEAVRVIDGRIAVDLLPTFVGCRPST
jgi:ring-1,2-phenylacetyl-CoA epoxidase subunit PaaD